MLHDKSTPPLPREAHRDRVRSTPHPGVRYSLPPNHNGRLIAPNAYLPPGPSHIKPPPPPPRIFTHHPFHLTVPQNIQKHHIVRYLPQSTTALASDAYATYHIKHCVINNVHNNDVHHNNYFSPYNHYTNYERQQDTKLQRKPYIVAEKPATNLCNDENRAKQDKKVEETTPETKYYASMNGITTYSVTFYTHMCGIELYPNNKESTTGAKVIKLHNLYAESKVIVNSLLVGINDVIALNMDYNKILKTIRFASRPLKLTFYAPTKYNTKKHDSKSIKNTNHLTLWLDSNDLIKFKCKK